MTTISDAVRDVWDNPDEPGERRVPVVVDIPERRPLLPPGVTIPTSRAELEESARLRDVFDVAAAGMLADPIQRKIDGAWATWLAAHLTSELIETAGTGQGPVFVFYARIVVRCVEVGPSEDETATLGELGREVYSHLAFYGAARAALAISPEVSATARQASHVGWGRLLRAWVYPMVDDSARAACDAFEATDHRRDRRRTRRTPKVSEAAA